MAGCTDECAISAKHARILLEDERVRTTATFSFATVPPRPQYSLLGCGHDNDSGDRHLYVGTSSLDRREGSHQTAGVVFTVMGILTGIGAVHFGKPRSERILNQTDGGHAQPLTTYLRPDYLRSSNGTTHQAFRSQVVSSRSHNEESRPASEGGAASSSDARAFT